MGLDKPCYPALVPVVPLTSLVASLCAVCQALVELRQGVLVLLTTRFPSFDAAYPSVSVREDRMDLSRLADLSDWLPQPTPPCLRNPRLLATARRDVVAISRTGCQAALISTRPKIKITSAVNRPPQLHLRVGHALKCHCVTAPQHLIRLAFVPRGGQLAHCIGWHGMAQFASGFRIPFASPHHFRIRCSGAGGIP